MALGYLSILLFVLILITIILQVSLYKVRDYSSNTIYVLNAIFSFVLSYLNFTSLPTNYTSLRIISLIWAVFGILGIIFKLKDYNMNRVSKYLLSISVIGGMIQLLI